MSEVIRRRRRGSVLRAFLTGEAGGGLLLVGAAALGLALANSPAADSYFGLLDSRLGPLSVLHWINDGLMAAFFLMVGLEMKRELLDGQLSRWSRRIVPGLAAIGGMGAPAVVFLAFNASSPETLAGWATPAATDIAFTLGVLALLGRRVPVSLKIFVTALAIIDDLGAVLVIALFYSHGLSAAWLAAAGAILALLVLLGRLGVRALWPYLVAGVALWACVLQSGVHATVAGVALALTIPLKASPGRPDDAGSPLHRLEHGLHPWVAYGAIPTFGFANAGVSLAGLTLSTLTTPVTLGVAFGLLVGKPIGIFAAVWAAVRLRLASLPEEASWMQVFGVAVLCGIGFTMSLFIGLLAFPDSPDLQAQVKVGVLAGSLLSALAGAAILGLARRRVLHEVRAARAAARQPG